MRVVCILNNLKETNIPYEAFDYLKHINSAGLVQDKIILSRKYNFIKDTWCFIKSINKERKSILHVHHCLSSLFVSLNKLICRSNYKIIYTVHSDFTKYSFFQKIVFVFVMLCSEKVVCNSRNTLHSLPKLLRYKFTNKFKVIYNGVNQHSILSTEGNFFEDSNNCVNVGMVGRLVGAKDYPTVLRAFKQLPCNIHLYVVGPGELYSSLTAMVDEMGISNVTFLGGLTRSETYNFIHSLDLFIAASKYEGFCNSLIEAKMAGIPTITSRNATFKELLNGLSDNSFDIGDHKSLSVLIQSVVNNLAQQKLFSLSESEFISEKYSLEANAIEHLKLYQEVHIDY